MPSFQDSAFLVLLALLLFGPKGLAKLAREIGKLMGEFRRASNEFRLQMEDEFRVSEQADQQKKIAAIEAAAPITPAFPAEPIPEPEHPHLNPAEMETGGLENRTHPEPLGQSNPSFEAPPTPEPIAPIASSGGMQMMPPSTGLPTGRTVAPNLLSGIFDSIPHVAEPEHAAPAHAPAHAQEETTQNA